MSASVSRSTWGRRRSSALLVDLGSGATVALGSVLNDQERFGADVISRITYAMEADGGLGKLRGTVLASIDGLLATLLRSSEIDRERIYQAVVAGNSTMLHMLVGVDPSAIALAPFPPVFAEPLDVAAAEVGIAIHPHGRVQTFPVVGAYVGADIVAGVLATGIGRDDRCSLLVDIGTNGEIVLATPDRILAAAAPAGPAFEGAQIRNGMRAHKGAIEAVRMDDDVELDVIEGGDPRGICGSGLADAVAGLRRVGLLDASGRLLRRSDGPSSHPLRDRLVEVDGAAAFRLADGVELTQRDLRELQYAKGAIAAGIAILLAQAEVEEHELDEILLAGSFGTYIDPASARTIGLVPWVDLDVIRPAGNSSLEGAKMALLSFREHQLGLGLASRIDYVELSSRSDFNDAFVGSLAFPALEHAR